MNKTGLITFHNAHNYGSVLQAYALQQIIIKKYGRNCELIEYLLSEQDEMYNVFIKNDSIKSIIKNLISLLNFRTLNRRYNSFESFKNNNLIVTKNKYYSLDELKNYKEEFDTLICGSDQVWNINAHDYNEAYFLTFAKENTKKISYAPSFGGYYPFNDKNMFLKEKIREYLTNFDFISVRENSGKETLNSIINSDVDVLVDPTFLLTKKEWDLIASKRIIKEEYIFFYSIDYNADAIKIAKKIGKEMNLPVVIIYTTNKTYKTIFSGFKQPKTESPSDFLSLIKYSSLVLSTSFHGSVFSIIYRKQFYVVRGTEEGRINSDDRLTTLMNKLNLENRELTIENYLDFNKDYKINYSLTKELIEFERKKSFDFLENALKRGFV